MDHEYWEERLQGYLDNELDPADHTAVRNHIESCPDCQANLHYFENLKKRLRAHSDSVKIPDSVRQRIEKQFEQKRSPLRRLWAPSTGFALAAAILLAFLVPKTWTAPYSFVERSIGGKVVCCDCTIAVKAGITKGELCKDGHNMGLETEDDKIWRFAHDETGSALHKDFSLIGRNVMVHGQFLIPERMIRIDTVNDATTQKALYQREEIPTNTLASTGH